MNNNYESVSTTLFIGNIPYATNQKQLEDAFSEVGPIRRCFLVRDKGVGYVTFALRSDAELAMKKVKTIGGRNINSKFAKRKSEMKKETHGGKKIPDNDENGTGIKEKTKEKKKKNKKKKINPKKAKLIIRNLSFKANKDSIKKAFEKFGKVVEVTIPKKTDGKMKGFCFVQFEKVSGANHAKQKMNGTEFLSRPIAVDWSVAKKEYLDVKSEEKGLSDYDSEQEKVENDDDDDDDESIADDTKAVVVKKKAKNMTKTLSKEDDVQDYVESEDESNKDEEEEEEDSEVSESDDSENNDESEDESDHSEDEEDDDSEVEVTKKEKKVKKPADVDEEKTLFIRNLSFDTTKDTLADLFSKFGPIHYAVICINKDTEYSKGSGFVKFRDREDAMKCLEYAKTQPSEIGDGSEKGGIVLDGQTLLVSLAVSRDDMQKKATDKQKKSKDNRNLYLAREGLIRAGTKAAEGVSKQDLAKRMQLEVWKQRMLKNYNIFVAKSRLCVRNLPLTITDTRLKRIFIDAGGPGAEVIEARVMKDLRQLTNDGNPSSKGYGFVKFTTHEHALKALRNTNNNPNIFTNNMRPIVEFSLENKSALNAKVKRLERSRQQNKQSTEKPRTNNKQSSKWQNHEGDGGGGNVEGHSYSGVIANTDTKTFPTHTGPKIRHNKRIKPGQGQGKGKITRGKLRRDDLKSKRNQRRNQKWEKKPSGEGRVRPSRKRAELADHSEAKFDKMINTHERKQVSNKNTSRKRKWFHND